MECKRYISIDPGIQNLPLNELLDRVKQLIKSHYQEQTSLPIWGEIKQYAFFCDEHTVIVLSPKGKVIDAVPSYIRSRAKIRI